MYPRGTIYPETTPLHASYKIKILYSLLRILGGFLVIGSCFYGAFCLAPVVGAEAKYSVKQIAAKPLPTLKPSPSPSPLPDTVEANFAQAEAIANVQKEAQDLGLDSHFSVVVPKIDAKAEVIANVNPGSYDEYMSALKNGVAHSMGTNFPGEGKLIYLFSHSTNAEWWASRYGAEFYLLNKLTKDDEVVIFFADKKYIYRVSEIKVVAPDDTSWLTDKGEGETLILQTCTPAGTNLKRLLVIAKPLE